MAMLLISHDLPLVAEHCDRVLVMYQGEKVDEMAAVSVAAGNPSLHAHALDLPPERRDVWPDAADARPFATVEGRPTMALVEVNQLRVSFGEKRRFPPPVLRSKRRNLQPDR